MAGGVWFEAWTLPHDGGALNPAAMVKKIANISVLDWSVTKILNGIGRGSITVRADYIRLGEILSIDEASPANDVGSVIRIRQEGNSAEEAYAFTAARISDPYGEPGNQFVDISGPGREDFINDAKLFPYDFPGPEADGISTLQLDWIYGGRNVLRNPGFEESTEITTGTGDDRVGTGTFRPTNWDISRRPDGTFHGNIDNPAGQPEEDGFTAEMNAVALEGDWVGNINPLDTADGGLYSGIQQIVRVKPGYTYTARLNLRTDSPPTFGWRLVMRNLEEGIAAGVEPPGVGSYDEMVLPADGLWHEFGPVEFVVPRDVDTIIFRCGMVTGTGNAVPLRFDDGSLNEGIDPANAGTIWQALLDDATIDHVTEPTAPDRDETLRFLKYDGFDGTNDSGGIPWPEALALTLKVGKSYGQLWSQFVELGYEADIVWNEIAQQYEFRLFGPLDIGGAGGIGTDLTLTDGPAIVGGEQLQDGGAIFRSPAASHTMVIGPLGNIVQRTESDLVTAFGRRESILLATDALDVTTVDATADAALDSMLDLTLGRKIVLSAASSLLPFRDFDVGDRMFVKLDGTTAPVKQRVRSIEVIKGEGGQVLYAVDFGSRVFRSGQAAQAEAVSQLLSEYRGLAQDIATLQSDGLLAGSASFGVSSGTDPAIPTITIAASDARDAVKAAADYVCTGTADETVFNTAISDLDNANLTEARVNLSEGTFTFTVDPSGGVPFDSSLTSLQRIHFHGAGEGITILEQDVAVSNSSMFVMDLFGTSVTGLEFSDLTARSVGAVAGGFFRDFLGIADLIVRRCHIDEFEEGFDLGVTSANSDTLFESCTFEDWESSGFGINLATQSVSAHRILNCRFTTISGAVGPAIQVGEYATLIIAGNVIEREVNIGDDGGQTAIVGNLWTPQSRLHITRVNIGLPRGVIVGNTGDSWSIDIDSTNGWLIEGNTFKNSDGDNDFKIRINGCEGIVVRGNLFDGHVSEHAIQLVDSNRCIVDSNLIDFLVDLVSNELDTDDTWDAINLSGDSDDNQINGNTIRSGISANLWRHGINISAATCDDNWVTNNNIRGAEFATSGLNDAGTGTVTTSGNRT